MMNFGKLHASAPKSSSWIRKAFGFLAMLVLLLLCSGCFCSMVVYNCDENCHEEIIILERRVDFSQDGKSLSVYLKKQTTSRRDPFGNPRDPVGKWQKVSVEEANHTYSLTSPEANAVLKKFRVIPNTEVPVWWRFYMQDFGFPHATRSSAGTFLPLLIRKSEAAGTGFQTLFIHPDDFEYLSGPFVLGSFDIAGRYELSLMIPYKQEGDYYYAYSPKEDLIGVPIKTRRPNASRTVWKVVLLPPAFVLDVVTSPLQVVAYIFIFRPLNKQLCYAPRESSEKMYS